MEYLREALDQVDSELGSPFLPEVGATLQQTNFDNVSNFFRSGPKRKVIQLNQDSGDYDHDPDLTQDQEIAMQLENEAYFETALAQLQSRYGAPLGHTPVHWESVVTTDDDEEQREAREDEVIDGIPWTPEYDQGAVVWVDGGQMRYWVIGDRYLFLQEGRVWGDGTFLFFVSVAISPVVGEPCLEGFWPESSACPGALPLSSDILHF
ncbi:hypothetical protein [Deinococcus hopiensis]|uniref:Uncharacterized protein n=1 Tax=Deinococcus hopiensis KR-140 TaxID=695939 RepID=A0A1W1UTV8_9DEIO|nr:hypothetical protein [Deinococcus hopiensis]SMB84480.1 hypothetical protein SAMN00790413_05148 [Deinococcus hopiensis KR-140]